MLKVMQKKGVQMANYNQPVFKKDWYIDALKQNPEKGMSKVA